MTGPALLPGWGQLTGEIPQVTGPMRRYLEQVACVLRPRSVVNTDQALRSFAAFLTRAALPRSSIGLRGRFALWVLTPLAGQGVQTADRRVTGFLATERAT